MKNIVCLMFLLPAAAFAGVAMAPEILPDPYVSLEVGQPMDIYFVTDSPDMPFFGAVEWVGVGQLSEPIYPGSPIIILPDPPYYPGFLPDNMWPIFYDVTSPIPVDPWFALTTYVSDVKGNATINLYDLGMDFSHFDLIDSFDIVVIPEPMTAVLLALGFVFTRRR